MPIFIPNTVVLAAVFLLVGLWNVEAHLGHSEWAQLSQYQRNWLQQQKRPGTNFSCCNEADADQVDEEIRYDSKGIGHYWVNSVKTRGQWVIVPDEAIIQEPNLHGRPVAWFRWINRSNNSGSTIERPGYELVVFCYAPGPLL